MGFPPGNTAAAVIAGTSTAIAGTTGTPAAGAPEVAVVQEAVNAVAASTAALALPDVTVATIHSVTLTANCTLTFPAAAAGKNFLLALTQDATGGRTVVWPGNVKWSGGTAPTLTTTAAKTDLLSFICVDGANWLGVVASENF